MNRKSFLSLSSMLPLALTVACGGGNDNLPPPPPPPPPAPAIASAAPPATASAAATPPPPPAPAITLTQGEASPDPAAPLPTVKILAPTKEQVIPAATAGDFVVKLDVKNWKTAMGDAHVHLILDAKPYKPIFDLKAPGPKLSELTGGEPLAEGQHVLVAFPSRANHESVKTKDALALIEFWVGKKGDKAQDITKPTLIYSRPKGEYKGDMANHVLVDFQLANDKLATDKDHVHIAVTGPGIDGEKTADATTFGAPFYLDNLQDGSYSVKLELQGADGKPLPGTWNSNARTFSIAH
jgi:hypothetical protein